MLGRLPLVEQLDGLRSVLSQNEVLTDVMTRAATMELPGWYVTAGCLFQTVWNVVTGRPPTSGIKDYDIFYFDGTDLSWEAEDAAIKAGQEVFAGLLGRGGDPQRGPCASLVRAEIRGALPASRVHRGTDRLVRRDDVLSGGAAGSRRGWRVYAPHGLSDVFNLVVRPNPVLAPREVYETKAARWRDEWPELTVLPWPG